MSPLFFVLSDLNSFPSGFPFHPSSSGLIQSFLSCHRSKALRPSCTNRLVHKLVLWSDQVADTRSQLTRKWIRERKCSHVFCPVLLGCFCCCCCCSCLGRSQHSLPSPASCLAINRLTLCRGTSSPSLLLPPPTLATSETPRSSWSSRDPVPKKLCSPPSPLPRLCSFPQPTVTIAAPVCFTLSNFLVRQAPQSQSATPKHVGLLLAEQ